MLNLSTHSLLAILTRPWRRKVALDKTNHAAIIPSSFGFSKFEFGASETKTASLDRFTMRKQLDEGSSAAVLERMGRMALIKRKWDT